MYGAIEFMRAWRDFCKAQEGCDKCEFKALCLMPEKMTDKEINDLVGIVMRKKAQREKEENE